MPKPTGYKATRKSLAQVRREHRERVWRNADVPPSWESRGANRELMRDMLDRSQINPFRANQEI